MCHKVHFWQEKGRLWYMKIYNLLAVWPLQIIIIVHEPLHRIYIRRWRSYCLIYLRIFIFGALMKNVCLFFYQSVIYVPNIVCINVSFYAHTSSWGTFKPSFFSAFWWSELLLFIEIRSDCQNNKNVQVCFLYILEGESWFSSFSQAIHKILWKFGKIGHQFGSWCIDEYVHIWPFIHCKFFSIYWLHQYLKSSIFWSAITFLFSIFYFLFWILLWHSCVCWFCCLTLAICCCFELTIRVQVVGGRDWEMARSYSQGWKASRVVILMILEPNFFGLYLATF